MREQAIAAKLETTVDAVQMLRTGDALSRAVAAGLAARFGLEPTAPIGQQLAARGLLSADEGAWLDGATVTQ